MRRTKELTRAELQVMNILWDIEKGTVREVLDKFPEPKPAYNSHCLPHGIHNAKVGFHPHHKFQ